MNLYEAIFVRKSIRKYKMKALDESILNDIMNFAGSLRMLYDGISVEYKIVDSINEPINFKGPFSFKAPYYLVLFSTKEEGYTYNAGYLLEQISLYLTTKGIGSCYLGMAKPKKGKLEVLDHEYVMTLAFGEGEQEIYRTVDNAKRLPIEDIAIYKENISRNVKAIMQAVRMSPSSMNSQPWKFVVYDNRIHIFNKKQIFQTSALKEVQEVDIGICIAHLLVAADELWVDCVVQHFDNISNKTFKKYDYVTSIKII